QRGLQQLPDVFPGRHQAGVGVGPRGERERGIQHLSRRLGPMKAWERPVFSLSALAVLAAIGVKLHELDMPVARFVRAFDSEAVNYSGDLVATLGQGAVIAGAFLLIGLLGWRLKRDWLRDMGIRGLV